MDRLPSSGVSLYHQGSSSYFLGVELVGRRGVNTTRLESDKKRANMMDHTAAEARYKLKHAQQNCRAYII